MKGYSQAPDSLRILHAFAAFSLGLRASAWFVWVPSKANIADQPSRGEFELLRELGSTEVPFVFPPFEAWDQPAEAWIARAMQWRGSVAIGNLESWPNPARLRFFSLLGPFLLLYPLVLCQPEFANLNLLFPLSLHRLALNSDSAFLNLHLLSRFRGSP